MMMRLTYCLMVLGLLFVAGCQQGHEESAEVRRATTVDTIEATAVVTDVNRENRQVELETEDGRLLTILAGPEVRNFDQIGVGDSVKAVYTQATVAHLAEPGDDASGPGAAVAGIRAKEGDKPAVAIGQEVRTIVEILSFDPSTNVVAFVLPDGFVRSVVVRKPEMQAFANTLQPGDKVEIAFAEAVGIGVLPSDQ